MKVLIVEPNRAPYSAEITDGLKGMQRIVGGLIDAVYPFAEPVALVCNDEGKLLGLPLNRALYDADNGKICDIVAGTFFLCGCPLDGDCFTSLTESQIQHYADVFHTPEAFIRVGGDVIAMPAAKREEDAE